MACAVPDPGVLATWRGGELTAAGLDAYVRALPEAERMAPPGTDSEAWLGDLVRRAAAARILNASPEVDDYLADPGVDLERRWLLADRLAAAVAAEIAAGVRIDEELLDERLAELDGDAPEKVELLNFRHLFLRFDRATDHGERRAIRERGRDLARRARAGDDFAELARRHSESANAAAGGMVENQRSTLLETTAREALAALREGEVSPLVETPTGLHVFRLERRLTVPETDPGKRRAALRLRLARQAAAEERVRLLDEVRQRVAVETGDFPWRVGSWRLDPDDVDWLTAGAGGTATREQLIERLLLAEEGRRRGYLTAELEAGVDAALRRQAVAAAHQRRLDALVADLPDEVLRPLYDAQPSGFASRETAHLELLFVPKGRRPFDTQRELEDRVAQLRAGAPFGELARTLSAGPAADRGGDLGPLPPSEWTRLHPEVYRAVAALDVGEVSDPIFCTGRLLTRDPRTLRDGFAVVKVRTKEPPRPRTFEEAVDDVRAAYAARHARELAAELEAAILDDAGFEIVRMPATGELVG